MKTKIFCFALAAVFLAAARAGAEEPQPVKKAMVIQVTPGTIALPEGEAARIPVAAARVRSTDMRDLDEQYNAVAIEKLYQLYDPATALPGSGSQAVLRSADKKAGAAALDLTKVMRKGMRKKMREEGKEVIEQPDAYLIEFELAPDVAMKDVVVAYWVLPVVTFAQEVEPEEE
ncbi:MAG: hypothetical protein ACM3L6_04835 [Deltaproteobacteria bacterium]